ncbi:hypothetical protein D3C73_1013920 [compost metagenome]
MALYSGTVWYRPSMPRPRPLRVSSQCPPCSSRSIMPSTWSPAGNVQGTDSKRPSGRRTVAPASVLIQRLPSGSAVSPLINRLGTRSLPMRSKSVPVQRATPCLVPTHRLPSASVARYGTDAAGTLRGLFASGRNRCRRSLLSSRYRPPSWVPNQIEPSGVAARLQTVLLPISGWLLRS